MAHIPSSAGPAPVLVVPSPAPRRAVESADVDGEVRRPTVSDSELPARLRAVAATALGILSPDHAVIVEAADELEYLREVVDALAAAQMDEPGAPEMDRVMSIVHAHSAVVSAAQAETQAEERALSGVLAAMTVRSGHPRHQAAQEATSELTAAKKVRRVAVTALKELEAS